MRLRLYGGYSLKRSLKDYGWAVALAVMLMAFALSWQGVNPVNEAEDHVAAPVARSMGIAASPATVRCLAGWTETTGTDPDGQINLKVCTSVDKRYVITVREGQKPVGFDGGTGNFLTDDETADFLR